MDKLEKKFDGNIDDQKLEILLKAAFEQVKCDDKLKCETLDKIVNESAPKRKRIFANIGPYCSPGMRFVAGVVCVIVTFVSGFCFYRTPAAAICLDGDMSLRLTVNRFDKVLDVKAYNGAAQDSIDKMNDKGGNSDEFIRNLMANNKKSSAEVYIISENKKLSNSILNKFKKSATDANKVDAMAGISCQTILGDVDSPAEKNDMTYQRYELYLKMQELGIALSPSEIKDITLADMRQMINDKIEENNKEQVDNNQQVQENQGEIGSGSGIIGNDHQTSPPIIEEPELVEPDEVEPDVAQPDEVRPDVAQPNEVETDVAQPNEVEPDIVQPNEVEQM